ncbi:leucyl/phenylalanyl-tRNA--protein transferase [bacterium]|nr:leucyl/phenylalanyl-tRNA--protein transferase [bacterium]
MIKAFPPIETADEDGVLAIGGDLEIPSLLLAYTSGIFPWPQSSRTLLWFAPPQRGILDFNDFHIPSRLKRDLKKCPYTFYVNRNFKGVIEACRAAKNRKGQNGTWITKAMSDAYVALYNAGYAMSFEAYDAHDTLAGGLYGVKIKKYFAGESMFYTKTNASKFALVNAVAHLKNEGLTWIDTQMVTPLVASFGGRLISRGEFMKKLEKIVK